jgi:hypothetical protein
MCDKDLWTDMVPGLAALGTIHHGNVYEDSTLAGMARRVLDAHPSVSCWSVSRWAASFPAC